MPWLEKGKTGKEVSQNLLFIHVPRCGGTSLMKSHSVPFKATKESSCLHRLGMTMFFHRYKLLESANFPIWTKGNAMCIGIIFATAWWRLSIGSEDAESDIMYNTIAASNIVFFLLLMAALTFIFVAPTIGRIIVIRRFFLVFVHYVLCCVMESIDYLTGTNIHGYLPHLTAHKMLHYGYVTPEQMEEVSSFAIVRNPYSRMVSIYMYNRFGSGESFHHFVKSWYQNMAYYRKTGEMEEWYTPCHVIPMFEYTHFEGAQLVQSIVKQEELKFLKNAGDIQNAKDSSLHDLPEVVRDALLGMPHTNKRVTSKPWYDYYDQETLELTYEMYQVDFEVFGYPRSIPQRPDLHQPVISDALAASVLRSKTSPSEDVGFEASTEGDMLPIPFFFESFSRDTLGCDNDEVMKKQRGSLFSSAASISARRSSMMRESSIRSLMGSSRPVDYGSLRITDLGEVSEETEDRRFV